MDLTTYSPINYICTGINSWKNNEGTEVILFVKLFSNCYIFNIFLYDLLRTRLAFGHVISLIRLRHDSAFFICDMFHYSIMAVIPTIRCSFEGKNANEGLCPEFQNIENKDLDTEKWVRVPAAGNSPQYDHTMTAGTIYTISFQHNAGIESTSE